MGKGFTQLYGVNYDEGHGQVDRPEYTGTRPESSRRHKTSTKKSRDVKSL